VSEPVRKFQKETLRLTPHNANDGVQCFLPKSPKERVMTQKVIEVVGTSKESFAKAAASAVSEAAKTVRSIKWAHVESFDMQLEGAQVVLYRATTKIYFDVEH
jgi:dodecin